MWINLFTIALAIAVCLGGAALVLQHMELQEAEPKRRRVTQRRTSRLR